MANQEVERYTFWAPGQADAYFYGYTRLRELRGDVEKAMGSRFRPRAFHDFILAQGLLPPRQLRKAVFEEFVGKPSPSLPKSSWPRNGRISGLMHRCRGNMSPASTFNADYRRWESNSHGRSRPQDFESSVSAVTAALG